MQVIIKPVFKYWTGANSASTQLIQIPRSRVQAQACLSAVDVRDGGRAWARIVDVHSAAFNVGPANFAWNTSLRATTDLIAVQVFTTGEAIAAAVGTVFVDPGLTQTLDPSVIERAAHIGGAFRGDSSGFGLLEAVEEFHWVQYGADGTVYGTHTASRYEGAEAIDLRAIESQLQAVEVPGVGESLQLLRFELDDLVIGRTLRVDPKTKRISVVD